MSINDLRIDDRIYEVLISNNITLVSQLTSKTSEEVKAIFGYKENYDKRTMYLRLRRAIRELGLNFKDEYVSLNRSKLIIEVKIERLNIPLETKKILKLNGVHNIGDLLSVDYKDLLCFSKMTSVHLNVILNYLNALGYVLKNDTSYDMNPIRLMVNQAQIANDKIRFRISEKEKLLGKYIDLQGEQQELLEREGNIDELIEEHVKRIKFVKK